MSDLFPEELDVIRDYISGGIVFDVGAYVGEWSRAVMKRVPDVKIHQFEPMSASFNALTANFSNETADGRVVVNNVAVSDLCGSVVFYHYTNCPVLSTIWKHDAPTEARLNLTCTEVPTNTITLDYYCEVFNITHIDFLKIDTEGAEFDVLKGARSLLERHSIKALQFEYDGCFLNAQVTLKSVFDYLTRYGFSIYKLHPDGLIHIPVFSDNLEVYDYSNFLATCAL